MISVLVIYFEKKLAVFFRRYPVTSLNNSYDLVIINNITHY